MFHSPADFDQLIMPTWSTRREGRSFRSMETVPWLISNVCHGLRRPKLPNRRLWMRKVLEKQLQKQKHIAQVVFKALRSISVITVVLNLTSAYGFKIRPSLPVTHVGMKITHGSFWSDSLEFTSSAGMYQLWEPGELTCPLYYSTLVHWLIIMKTRTFHWCYG